VKCVSNSVFVFPSLGFVSVLCVVDVRHLGAGAVSVRCLFVCLFVRPYIRYVVLCGCLVRTLTTVFSFVCVSVSVVLFRVSR
jgi:hypothetical protein